MYRIVRTKEFEKSFKRVKHSGKLKKQAKESLREIIDILALGEKVPSIYKDHQLTGEFGDCRECHIKGDLLLVYQIRQSNDSVSSAKAFFASDTGLEITSWCYFKGCDAYRDYNDNDCNISDSDNTAPFEATDPPASSCVFNPSSGVAYEIDSTLTDEKLNIISRGYAAGENVIRILEAEFATQ